MLNNMIDTFLNKPLVLKTSKLYISFLSILEKMGMPMLILFIRFWIAKIFWYSGLTKISSWQSTIYLFQYEYKVPVINPELAAYFATTFELACPVLFVIGLCTRLATLPMLAMTVVIQLTYLDLIEHYYWGMLLTLILFYGPGKLSLDNLLYRKFSKKR